MDGSNINLTYGSAFIGLIAGAILYGVTLLQTFLYYRTYPQDSRFIKFLVFFLWCVIAMQPRFRSKHKIQGSGYGASGALHHLDILVSGDKFRQPSCVKQDDMVSLLLLPCNRSVLTRNGIRVYRSMNLQTDCNGLIGLIVECFFARRVWIMSGNLWLTGVIVVLSFVHFVEGFILTETTKFGELVWVTSAGLGSAAAADIIIACALCYYLTKNRTGFSRTDSLITTLIAYSLTTGLTTSVIAFIAVVTFAIMPTNFIWLAFFWILGKMHRLCEFTSSGVDRDFLRGKVAPRDCTLPQLTPFRAITSNVESPITENFPPMKPGAAALSVHIHTVSKAEYDYTVSTEEHHRPPLDAIDASRQPPVSSTSISFPQLPM
ncbi:hypothetical protein D9615_002946 [Tricholomella constricta]|uniref:DUF6534 domain-containing protein n=1 Tax=Tricholomella constricta TaxID=117010 RepID=A0A8H5HGG7_9AGAR|nr:hypothetical protein D9615_002946 [Tricholomella constricta]